MKPEGPERLGDHVCLVVFAWVLSPLEADAAIERAGAAGQRNRLLPARMTVYYVMALAMFGLSSYEEVMRSLLAGMEWITGLKGLDDVHEGRDLQDPDTVGIRGDIRLVRCLRQTRGTGPRARPLPELAIGQH